MINAIKDKRARRHQTSKLPRGKNGGIELILLQDVDKLGKIGDLVEVKRGYAVNYLIPQGQAAVATEKTRQLAEARKAEAAAAHAKKIADAQEIVKKLATSPLTLTATTDDNGNLYGSIYKKEIAAALKEKGIEVKADNIGLEGPIKVTGFYSIPVRVFEGIEGKVDITVDRA
ncbi:MAG: 50S ribosomal protein L9 [Thermoguttaceae bacterium]|nr:50S ribosomal protein L9 [Thermoguttaceae bacterium]